MVENIELQVQTLTESELSEIENIIDEHLEKNYPGVMKFKLTCVHEMGHLKKGMQKGFHFSFIRVADLIIYKNQTNTIVRSVLSKEDGKVANKKASGVCFIYADEERVEQVSFKQDLLEIINEGPICTDALFKESGLSEKIFFMGSWMSNSVKDSKFFHLNSWINKTGDQGTIKRIEKEPTNKEAIELNNYFKSVNDALDVENTYDKSDLPEHAVIAIEAIRNLKIFEKEIVGHD